MNLGKAWRLDFMNSENQNLEVGALVASTIENKSRSPAENGSKENLAEKCKNLFEKLKFDKSKGIKLLVLIICFSIVLIFCLNFTTNSKTKRTNGDINYRYQTGLEYSASLEKKLENLISKIKGVGQVTAMVYLSESPKLILAESTDEKVNTTTSGSSSTSYTTTVTEPIILTNSGYSSPLILTEQLPEIHGVVIVAEGAGDISVKLNIIQAIKTLIDISSGNIQVFES